MRIILFMVLLLAFCCGCSEDFKTVAPYRDITVVTGVLRMEDTAHYIAVRRAFSNEEQDALLSAKIPDSALYRNLTVTFIESADGKSITSQTPLQLVDLNTEGYPKEEGVFVAMPNYVYKLKLQLNPESYYRLVIVNNETGRRDSSKPIRIVDGKDATRKLRSYDHIYFSDSTGIGRYFLGAATPSNGYFVKGGIKIHYTDSNINTGEKDKRSLMFYFGDTLAGKNYFSISIAQEAIFNNIAGNIPAAPEGVVRLLGKAEVWHYVASKEVADYWQHTENRDQFIRADMIQPMYGNMLTNDTYGILASATCSGHDSSYINDKSLIRLINDPLTKKLNFIGRSND